MKIGVLGSGTVGQTIGAKLAGLGHEVMIGTRSPEKLSDWKAKNEAEVGSFADTAPSGQWSSTAPTAKAPSKRSTWLARLT
jgi:8-hydroxy-5-deazaflavin:NADPH oxidoreductase